jgi:predicted DNA-binding protein (MmcQ/YjbR family)
MARAPDIPSAVAQLCDALPEVESKHAHGSPAWSVRGGRRFAVFTVNHHGDGHVGLLLKPGPGEQSRLIDEDPAHFYMPAYYGPSGWVGVELNGELPWSQVIALTAASWRNAAPASLRDALSALPKVPRPRRMTPEEVDPFRGKHGRALLEGLRELCEALPETCEDSQFGAPCFRVGKKTFCVLHQHRDEFAVQAWVGEEGQATLTFDDRYRIPAYIGRNGWIELGFDAQPSWAEVESLVLQSYRHFAPKRAVKQLDAR